MPVLAIALMNAVIYRDYWTGFKLFTGKDFLAGFAPLLIFQSDCLQELSLPLWNPFMNFGYPFVEHFSNSVFFPTHLIMGLITGTGITIIQRDILLWITIGGMGIYLCVREFGHSMTAGIIAAASFMFSGQMVALPQWHVLVYNASCFPFFILGYHRAARQKAIFSPLTIAFIAMSVFGGYIVSTVLSLYFFALYVVIDSIINKRFSFGIKYLFVAFAVSALLTAPKLVPLYQAMEFGPRIKAYSAEASRDPFNTINFYNFMSFMLPVKYYFSLFIGQISVIALIYGALKKKLQFNALALLFILSAWLLMVDSEGNLSMLRSATMFLPLMKLVRNEWLEWFFPSLFAILYLSRYIDIFLSDRKNIWHYSAVALSISLLSAVFFLQYNTALYLNAYLTHIALILLWMSLIFINNRQRAQSVAVIILITAEFLLVFNRVNVDEPPIREGDRVRVAVIDQGSVSRSYREDNLVRSKFYAASVQDQLRPSVNESRKRPYLISGLGDAPTINAYPEQYGNFIDYMNLKFFAGWWYNVQERFDFIRLKESQLLPMLDNQPLIVYLDGISGNSVPDAVSIDKISCTDFIFSIKSGTPGFLTLRQMYDTRWKASVDNSERPVKHSEDYFMGVEVKRGEKTVTFKFVDRNFIWSTAVSALTLSCLLGWQLFSLRRRTDGDIVNRKTNAGGN